MLDSILAALSSENPWRKDVQYFDTITSTNDVLKLLAAQGAPEGTCLIAGSQSGGRGRLGRSFHSPPEAGVYMSVLLRPKCTPLELMHLTCAAGCAACDAIQSAMGFRPGIKWINDIVYQKRKLAGILVEMGLAPDGTVSYAVIGIGINCNQDETDFPPEIRSFAGSLKMSAGVPANRAVVAARMVDAFAQMNARLLTHQADTLAQYRRDCVTIGKNVNVIRSECSRSGKALDVDDAGALVVQYTDGAIEHVNSGEVSVRGLYGYV